MLLSTQTSTRYYYPGKRQCYLHRPNNLKHELFSIPQQTPWRSLHQKYSRSESKENIAFYGNPNSIQKRTTVFSMAILFHCLLFELVTFYIFQSLFVNKILGALY